MSNPSMKGLKYYPSPEQVFSSWVQQGTQVRYQTLCNELQSEHAIDLEGKIGRVHTNMLEHGYQIPSSPTSPREDDHSPF
jgi:hypothetical protein